MSELNQERRGGRPTSEGTRLLSKRILVEAKRQFLERGYNDTTFETIAAEVGTSRGALYTRFPDKVALFAEVVKTEINLMCTRKFLAIDDDLPLRDSLYNQAAQIISVSTHPGATALYDIIIRDAPRNEAINEALQSAWHFYVSHIKAYFELRMRKGMISINNCEKAAEVFLGLVFQAVHVAIVHGFKVPAGEELAPHIHRGILVFLGGMGRLEIEGDMEYGAREMMGSA